MSRSESKHSRYCLVRDLHLIAAVITAARGMGLELVSTEHLGRKLTFAPNDSIDGIDIRIAVGDRHVTLGYRNYMRDVVMIETNNAPPGLTSSDWVTVVRYAIDQQAWRQFILKTPNKE